MAGAAAKPDALPEVLAAMRGQFNNWADYVEEITASACQQSLFASWSRLPPGVEKGMSAIETQITGTPKRVLAVPTMQWFKNPPITLKSFLDRAWISAGKHLAGALSDLYLLAKQTTTIADPLQWSMEHLLEFLAGRRTRVFWWLRRVLDRDSIAQQGQWEACFYISDTPLQTECHVAPISRYWAEEMDAALTDRCIERLWEQYEKLAKQILDAKRDEIILEEARSSLQIHRVAADVTSANLSGTAPAAGPNQHQSESRAAQTPIKSPETSETAELSGGGGAISPERKPRRRSGNERRKQAIRAVVAAGHTGFEYARVMDERGIKIPSAWLAEECPRTYAQAYRIDKWKQRIQNEKSKASKA
jgi:hypothetical protein